MWKRRKKGEEKKKKKDARHYYRATANDVIKATMRIVHWTATLADPETFKTNFR